jgi:hypothetical protein
LRRRSGKFRLVLTPSLLANEERSVFSVALRSPGFPVRLGGVSDLHVAFLKKAAHVAIDGTP